MAVSKFTVDKTNVDRYIEVEERLIGDNAVDSIPLDAFKYKKKDIFLSITNNEAYRPGHVDNYVEVNGKVYLIDDLNDDEAILLDLTKEQVLEAYNEFVTCVSTSIKL